MPEQSVPRSSVSWNPDGLVPAIVQHHRTGEVLMMAWMDRQALDLTITTRVVHFWSRSRRTLWKKGETSGNTLTLVELAEDCDRDTLLVKAIPAGPTCHTSARTCFVDPSDDGTPPQGFADLENLWSTVVERLATQTDGSYTAYLADGGPTVTGRKVIEEAAELAAAALEHQGEKVPDFRVAEEAADLIYHLLVLLAERGVSAEEVVLELAGRRR